MSKFSDDYKHGWITVRGEILRLRFQFDPSNPARRGLKTSEMFCFGYIEGMAKKTGSAIISYPKFASTLGISKSTAKRAADLLTMLNLVTRYKVEPKDTGKYATYCYTPQIEYIRVLYDEQLSTGLPKAPDTASDMSAVLSPPPIDELLADVERIDAEFGSRTSLGQTQAEEPPENDNELDYPEPPPEHFE